MYFVLSDNWLKKRTYRRTRILLWHASGAARSGFAPVARSGRLTQGTRPIPSGTRPGPPTQIDVLTVAKRSIRVRVVEDSEGGNNSQDYSRRAEECIAWLGRESAKSNRQLLLYAAVTWQSLHRAGGERGNALLARVDTRRKKRLDHASRLIPAPRAF